MLHEVGIMRSECYVTNLVNARPPSNDITAWIPAKKKDITSAHVQLMDRKVLPIIKEGYESLVAEIAAVKPAVIVPFGNTSMWTLTGKWGITKWRGSMLEGSNAVIIPTYHPAAILRQWDWRPIAINDLRRVKRVLDGSAPAKPQWKFLIRPSFVAVIDALRDLWNRLEAGEGLWLDFDLETRAGHIACAGISWSLTDAISIPFMCVENKEGYWSLEEEAFIVWWLWKVLTHPKALVRGQNLLYDCQYTYRHWLFVPRVAQDTMISHHVAFAGLPKRLDFQASMYCDHYVYWKDDGKEWDRKMGEDQLWIYNCEDCVRTRECGEVEEKTIAAMGLTEVDAFQQELFWAALQAMQRGIRIDRDARNRLTMELQEEIAKREQFFIDVLGHPLNPRSSLQMTNLFYNDLHLPPIMTRAKKGVPGHVTCDEEALEKIATREPILRPLVKSIIEYRSLGVFLSTFVLAGLDTDGRMRCSFNICGTETFRFSSSESAFGSGTNLQNQPKGNPDPKDPTELRLPNVRRLFIPDPGFTFFDLDLDRADLQVVVWEAGDVELKQMLREGVDMHTENAKSLGLSGAAGRQLAKVWVHGTNYGGSARTMAANCAITTHQAEGMRKRWFSAHPGIAEWHTRTELQLRSKRFVENKFGYRRHYFDRPEGILSEALAWIPQSTVACTINRAWLRIFKTAPEIQVLLQVHDSLAGQFPTPTTDKSKSLLKELSTITIPYDDPLVIPTGLKTSERSWGDCV